MKKFLFKKMLLSGLVTSFSIFATTFAAQTPALPENPALPAIHVDQVGYLTNYKKIAIVTEIPDDISDFKIVNVKTGQIVFNGKLSASKFDEMSGENVRTADFTSLKTPGTYQLWIRGIGSYEFEIGNNVYALATIQNLRSFTLSRCNNPMSDSVTGLIIEKGHPQDKNAILYFSDELNKKGEIFDMSGGWYDAGDYGKYTTTAAISTAELLLAYELHPNHFTSGQLFFPKGVQTDKKMPDLLTEVKYELDWVQKMQRSDGSTFHKVAGAKWPSHAISPDTDTQDRFIYNTCSAATAMYGATLAIGARVYKNFDANYSEKLLNNAKRAWAYLEKTPKSIYRTDEGHDGGSGPYNDENDIQERVWLAAELFKTTGDKNFENYLKSQNIMTNKPSFFTWDDTLALAQYTYATTNNADTNFQNKVKSSFISYADEIVNKIANDGYNCALAKNEYTWASTKNTLTMGDVLLMANEISPKSEYVEGALDQIHYMFGRNSLNRSFMTGVGAKPPEHPHNRIHESTGAYVPGLLVGGPNFVSGGDPDQTKYLENGKIPPAKAYLDVLPSWSTNEYAIDYTSAASFALVWFSVPDQKIKIEQLKLKNFYPSITIK